MGKKYACDNCGSVMEFDPVSHTLKCPNCETSVQIDHDPSSIIEHTMTHQARASVRVEEKSSHTMECTGCGAKVEIDATSTATSCPYCGSQYVLSQKQEDALLPDGVVPFKITRENANVIFSKWVSGRFWAPSALKNLYQQDKLQGIYIPYWTFDAYVHGRYTAQGGIDKTVEYKNSKGERETRIETDWYRVSGHIANAFDDVLVPASSKLKENLLSQMDYFNTSLLVSYSPQYLSGFSAECFTVPLDSAHDISREKMKKELLRLIENEVLQKYDRVASISVNPQFDKETYKHILTPIYTLPYSYQEKIYHVLINGQTGEVKGEYPKSALKIAIATVLGILALIILYFLFFS